MKSILAIDPGANGGFFFLSDQTMFVERMPSNYTDMFDRFLDITATYAGGSDYIEAVVEDVGYGLPNQSSKATATFARHCGQIDMALYALGVREIKVKPQKWQKYFSNSVGVKPLEKQAWKNRLKTLAKQLYPALDNITLYTADAVLIAEWYINSRDNEK